jgi:Leucine-rich repeat (LRR) protein
VKLDLKGNQLSTLNEIDYRRMIQLKELNLSDNKITKKSQPGLEKELSKIRKRGITVLLPVQPARKRQKPKSKSIFSK